MTLECKTCSESTRDSKKKSIVESLTDIIIGFVMYLPINFFILPMFAGEIANQEIIGFLQKTLNGLNLLKMTLRRRLKNLEIIMRYLGGGLKI